MTSDDASSTISSLATSCTNDSPSTNPAIDGGRGPQREGWENFPWERFPGYTINELIKRTGWTWTHGYDIFHAITERRRWVCRHCVQQKRRPLVDFTDNGTENHARHLVKLLIDEFNRHKGIVTELLHGAPGLIYLSFDGWTSRNNLSLLGLNIHFLSREGKVRQFLIRLPEVEGRYTGVNLAEEVAKIIAEWGIGGRIGYFITDNADNNDTCLDALAKEYGFNKRWRRLRCCAHIINLIIRQLLFGHDPDAFKDNANAPQELLAEYQLWRRCGPLGKLHNIVYWLSRSPQMTKKLLDYQRVYCQQPLNVITDNMTRWNSSNTIIKRALNDNAVKSDVAALPDGNYLRVSVNLAWSKLDDYYKLLDDSPVYVAAIMLHPAYGWD
ncbi:HAT domain-containing protein [Botryosphaeria dothidea]|uniref:HAT domain-containing protein n=1 Tax=Botryosphaeria dothidea TaxID=55169 RepID=A0A8H4J890_9PEZI|nr:HAT domain-containing protein [Botryosphaeria dothidea]